MMNLLTLMRYLFLEFLEFLELSNAIFFANNFLTQYFFSCSIFIQILYCKKVSSLLSSYKVNECFIGELLGILQIQLQDITTAYLLFS